MLDSPGDALRLLGVALAIGVVGLDPQHRITLANDHARSSLGLPADCVGREVAELDLDSRLLDVLTGRVSGADQVVLRDRTELLVPQNELDANRHATDTLRAQAHEFSNRPHTISGLIELGEYDEVRGFVHRISSAQGQWQVWRRRSPKRCSRTGSRPRPPSRVSVGWGWR